MTLADFARKTLRTGWEYGPLTASRLGTRELRRKLRARSEKPGRPYGVADQSKLLDDLLSGDDEAWVIWLDGGRLDVFDDLVWDHLDGDLRPAWNGDVAYSGDWAERHLERDLEGMGLFSTAALRSLDWSDYDGRDHFDVAPEIDTGATAEEKLAALGYIERMGSEDPTNPEKCNREAFSHECPRGGVIRYLRPHPPLVGLEDITTGRQKTRDTWHALWTDELTTDELWEAYIETYKVGLEAAARAVDELDGRVVLTADHGECLGDCGQLWHGRRHSMHDHLRIVPWFEVER